MIVKAKVRGFICTTAHPVGCRQNVQDQINYVTSKGPIDGPKRVLVIGSSTGYGLSSRITAAFGSKADTIGVFYEKASSENKTGTAGWYNDKAFVEFAKNAGLVAESVNGDAFSHEVKAQVIDLIKGKMPGGMVDLIVYSLASPRRIDPDTKEIYGSVIKPIGAPYVSKTCDFHTEVVSDVTIEPASEKEITETIAVMGGQDWLLWIDAMKDAGVLAKNVATVAYSYIGPVVTHAVYKDGTIGKAKQDLENSAAKINLKLANMNGHAFISVNKALVTQASSAIPVVPLYISLLYKAMKAKGTHEGCIEQMYRLYSERLYVKGNACNWSKISVDNAKRIRMDDWEMDSSIQQEVDKLWPIINSENILEISDLKGYQQEFFKLFGFNRSDVDYDADVSVE